MRFLPLAFTLALLAPTASAAASMAMPQWSAGDFWEMTGASPDGSTSFSRDEVLGVETITVNGVAYETLHTRATMGTRVAGQPDRVEQTSDDWDRVSDGASVRYRYDATASGGSAGGGDYAAPCLFVAWPLEVGKTWSIDCADANGATHANATVVKEETVTTPKGDFDALLVDTLYSGTDHVLAWYSPAACSHVKTSAAGGADPKLLADFRCAHAAGATDATPPVSSTPHSSSAPAPSTPASSTPADETPEPPSKRDPGPEVALLVGGVLVLALVRRRA